MHDQKWFVFPSSRDKASPKFDPANKISDQYVSSFISLDTVFKCRKFWMAWQICPACFTVVLLVWEKIRRQKMRVLWRGKVLYLDQNHKNNFYSRFYRLNLPRELGSLFSLNNGCSYEQAGIGNIEFVKDLLTQSINKNFKCSNFGPHTYHMLGWVYRWS